MKYVFTTISRKKNWILRELRDVIASSYSLRKSPTCVSYFLSNHTSLTYDERSEEVRTLEQDKQILLRRIGYACKIVTPFPRRNDETEAHH